MDYDILIVGGGLVGMSLALGLKNRLNSSSLKVGLIDPALDNAISRPLDYRTLALNLLSCKILQKLSLSDFGRFSAYPIQTVHISKQGKFAMTRLKASDIGLPVLGYSIEISTLITALQLLLAQTDCALIPSCVKGASRDAEGWKVQLETNAGIKEISAKLLIAADGDNSFLRKILAVPVCSSDYEQSAMITTVEMTKLHENTAFERFIFDGSIALLPIAERKAKLVWIASTEAIKALASLDENEFLAKLKAHFGSRLGQFHTLGNGRLVYPLKSLQVGKQVQDGFALIGNAAHVLHPIAAQGFNLSLREIAIFIEVINQAIASKKSFASEEWLQKYLAECLPDQKRTTLFTQSLASLVSKNLWPTNALFAAFIHTLEFIPLFKRELIRGAMGSASNLPSWVF